MAFSLKYKGSNASFYIIVSFPRLSGQDSGEGQGRTLGQPRVAGQDRPLRVHVGVTCSKLFSRMLVGHWPCTLTPPCSRECYVELTRPSQSTPAKRRVITSQLPFHSDDPGEGVDGGGSCDLPNPPPAPRSLHSSPSPRWRR